MILQKIKEHTKYRHQHVENLVGSHRLEKFTTTDYLCLVLTNYIFHHTIEQAFLQTVPSFHLRELEFDKRIKSSDLHHDLKQYGLDINATTPKKICFESYEYALGWLYVAEGSMLGGKYIHRILAQNPNLDTASFSFYENYSPQIPHLWQLLKEHIRLYCNSNNTEENILMGVKDAYEFFEVAYHYAKKMISTHSTPFTN